MFEFYKLCNEYEKLAPAARGALLAEKSAAVIFKIKRVDIEGVNPLDTLAAFILGSIVSDGAVNEKEYLFIYPALIKVFGDFDFATVKLAYKAAKDVKKEIERRTDDLMKIISASDEDLRKDVISLCHLTTWVDGKITLKERRYIRRLLRK